MNKNWMDSLVEDSTAARYIAWVGELEFAGCTEDDRTGRTVSFLLRRPTEDLTKAHPFSAHTRRRRGHVGTMFTMSLAAFDGETPATKDGLFSVMLLNWGSGPKGDTVKFLLNFETERHPFLGCQRAAKDERATRWMSTFLEEDDQSQPVNQAQRDRLEPVSHRSICVECDQPLRREPNGPHQGELRGHLASCSVVRPKKQQIRNSNLAAQFIKNPVFWQYLETHGEHVGNHMEADGILKLMLRISSKAELDSDPSAAAEFTRLREEFVAWQQANGIDPTA